MQKQRLVSAVFTTFCLEPSFFETEVLPVFLDIPLSHAPAIKLVQLEDALRSLPGSIAVYYDRNGLVADGGAAKLDIQRIPIHHASGIFHPKNVLALVESIEPDETGNRTRALLCSCASANLTRAGWWENVEVAHVEVIEDGKPTRLRDALLGYLDALVQAAEGRRPNDELRASHGALQDIHNFLRRTTRREQRSIDGRLWPHFHDGQLSLPDFIEETAGKSLRGLCLEVISPYFDSGGASAPLEALTERFEPSEARVFLPRNERGEALCEGTFFDWVTNRAGVSWGALPGDLLRLGKAEDAKHRSVHAKVYRFFEPKRGGREVLYVGSTNLTTAGCRLSGRGGNWETGFLVECTTNSRPDWWLTPETKRPPAFNPRDEDEGKATSGGTRLILRFHWGRHEACAFWGDKSISPPLFVRHGGISVVELSGLPSRIWTPLDTHQSAQLQKVLASTSLLQVVGEGPEPGLLLVQEEGMAHRPSLLLDLTAADILHYWALLTVEQRAAFIEAHAPIAGDDDPLIAKFALLPAETTLFDRFAGVFHAFECLEERVREALERGRTGEADYRLFGKKYDSLGTLLDRVMKDVAAEKGDAVDHYVVVLCATQLLREIGKKFPDYWADHPEDVRTLAAQIDGAASIRASLATRDPEMAGFLDWFDGWFLNRAKPVSEGETE